MLGGMVGMYNKILVYDILALSFTSANNREAFPFWSRTSSFCGKKRLGLIFNCSFFVFQSRLIKRVAKSVRLFFCFSWTFCYGFEKSKGWWRKESFNRVAKNLCWFLFISKLFQSFPLKWGIHRTHFVYQGIEKTGTRYRVFVMNAVLIFFTVDCIFERRIESLIDIEIYRPDTVTEVLGFVRKKFMLPNLQLYVGILSAF